MYGIVFKSWMRIDLAWKWFSILRQVRQILPDFEILRLTEMFDGIQSCDEFLFRKPLIIFIFKDVIALFIIVETLAQFLEIRESVFEVRFKHSAQRLYEGDRMIFDIGIDDEAQVLCFHICGIDAADDVCEQGSKRVDVALRRCASDELLGGHITKRTGDCRAAALDMRIGDSAKVDEPNLKAIGI